VCRTGGGMPSPACTEPAAGEPDTQTLRHMTVRPTSSRVLVAMLVLVLLAGCSDGGASSDSCEPGVSPCDDTNELQTFVPEVVPGSWARPPPLLEVARQTSG
jgi:hypothetical protein